MKYYNNPYDEELYTYKREEEREKKLKREALNLTLLIMSPFFFIFLIELCRILGIL